MVGSTRRRRNKTAKTLNELVDDREQMLMENAKKDAVFEPEQLRIYCVVAVESGVILYTGTSEYTAATRLVPGTTFGVAKSRDIARQWATLRARRWLANKRQYGFEDWNEPEA